jgi:hypothetical protein
LNRYTIKDGVWFALHENDNHTAAHFFSFTANAQI